MTAMSTEMSTQSLLIKITCGAEAAERANQAWTVAAMGVAAGASVSVWLTGEAVWFAAPAAARSPAPVRHASRGAGGDRQARRRDHRLHPMRRPARTGRGRPDRVGTIQGAASFVEEVLRRQRSGTGTTQAASWPCEEPTRSSVLLGSSASCSALISPGLAPLVAARRATMASRSLIGAVVPSRCAIIAISPLR